MFMEMGWGGEVWYVEQSGWIGLWVGRKKCNKKKEKTRPVRFTIA